MAKNITLILFLSAYTGQPGAEYKTDRDFTVSGAQTNEAPVRYAIRRLAEKGESLARIISLTTPQAKTTALEKFIRTVTTESLTTGIIVIDIPDNVTATELLQKTLAELLPLTPDDSVIIETTGGYRSAVNAITLLSRFLRYSGINVEFSTYSDFQAHRVSDTRETDELFELLDAVDVFAATGNARGIKRLFGEWKLDEKKTFFQASNDFYNSLLVCRAKRIGSDILELKKAIDGLNSAKYSVEEPKLLIFRDLVLAIVEQKMTFLRSENQLADFIKWCSDNWYLQQAVTFLKESLVHNNPRIRRMLTNYDFNVLRILRNSINHASGKAVYGEQDANITEKVVQKVNKLLEKPNEIKEFVKSLLTKIK
jgi:hypothetical protein